MTSLIRAMQATTPEMLDIFGDEALLGAVLRFETELARAGAAENLIDPKVAEVIARCCRAPLDVARVAREAAHAGTLAIPVVRMLRERVAAQDLEAAAAVHRGGTSQDVADTALVLLAKRAAGVIQRDATRLCKALVGLTRLHAETPAIGRTLLQDALPITFGLKTAQWLLGVDDALARLAREADGALVLQFGGAAGTLSDLGDKAFAVSARLAVALDLGEPALPWQARRGAFAGLGAALAILTGALGKIARDIALLAQAGVAEAFESQDPGRGGSSAMAHKRNPAGCQVTLSAALRAPGLAATLLSGLPQEHERGLGGWQAEAPVLVDLFCLAHGAVAAMLPVLEGLDVRADAMLANLRRAQVGEDAAMAADLVRRALARRAPVEREGGR